MMEIRNTNGTAPETRDFTTSYSPTFNPHFSVPLKYIKINSLSVKLM